METLTAKYKPYPTYKPSDVPRLDNVPAIGPWFNLEALGNSLRVLAEQRKMSLPQAVVVIAQIPVPLKTGTGVHSGTAANHPPLPLTPKIPLDILSNHPVH